MDGGRSASWRRAKTFTSAGRDRTRRGRGDRRDLAPMRGGFVICQFGGLVVPDEGDLRPLASVLECPLFLVR